MQTWLIIFFMIAGLILTISLIDSTTTHAVNLCKVNHTTNCDKFNAYMGEVKTTQIREDDPLE